METDHLETLTNLLRAQDYDALREHLQQVPHKELAKIIDKPEGSYTLLETAAISADARGAKILLEAGADATAHKNSTINVLLTSRTLSETADRQGFIELLLEHGFDIHADNGAAVIDICSFGDTEILATFLSQGADLSIRNFEAILMLFEKDNIELLEFVHRTAPEALAFDEATTETAYRWVIANKSVQCFEFLNNTLQAPFPYNFEEDAVQLASQEPTPDLVKQLKAAKVDILLGIEDYPEVGAVQAARCGQIDVLRYFLDEGAEIHARLFQQVRKNSNTACERLLRELAPAQVILREIQAPTEDYKKVFDATLELKLSERELRNCHASPAIWNMLLNGNVYSKTELEDLVPNLNARPSQKSASK